MRQGVSVFSLQNVIHRRMGNPQSPPNLSRIQSFMVKRDHLPHITAPIGKAVATTRPPIVTTHLSQPISIFFLAESNQTGEHYNISAAPQDNTIIRAFTQSVMPFTTTHMRAESQLSEQPNDKCYQLLTRRESADILTCRPSSRYTVSPSFSIKESLEI